MTSFTSYWGSSVHGVEIEWTADTSADPVELTFVYTANYYWRMPFFYDSAQTDTDLKIAQAIDVSFGEDVTSSWSTDTDINGSEIWYMKFYIAHPTDTSLFDGFNGEAYATFSCGDAANGGDNPSIFVEWYNTATNNYDLKPTSAFDDEAYDSTGQDNWELTENTGDDGSTRKKGDNLCTEQWVLSNTAAACVKTVGGAKRKFTTDDTSGEDIELDYVVYAITTEFGLENDTDANS